jgi:hypothetical protein
LTGEEFIYRCRTQAKHEALSEKEDFMKMRVLSRVSMLVLILVFAGSYARAGDLTVNIGQPFEAGGKSYPPGRYRVLADADSDHINLSNLDRKTDDEIKFTTRLSPREGNWGEVVFDKVEDNLYLAEIYIVGMDGFFLPGPPGKHKHLVLKEDLSH